MRLNKYVAHAGVCSRRKADELIAAGKVKVNGKVVLEMGHRVSRSDTITYNGKKLIPEKHYYILLNKPKDTITTTSDEKGRKTVLDIINPKLRHQIDLDNVRLYPVGRLDRNTTGVLLISNDGELAKNLTHPSKKVKKIYHATLNKPITQGDFQKVIDGVVLEDGPAPIDKLAFPNPNEPRELGLEIHIGKNRIVRRIFEHLGYEVVKLDRVFFAGMTKKDLPRGKWRFLREKEVIFLKHFGEGKTAKKPRK